MILAGLDETASDKEAFSKIFKVPSVMDIKPIDYQRAMAMINDKKAKLKEPTNA
jgi:hypothetical protein